MIQVQDDAGWTRWTAMEAVGSGSRVWDCEGRDTSPYNLQPGATWARAAEDRGFTPTFQAHLIVKIINSSNKRTR